jgi:hypothetical protein
VTTRSEAAKRGWLTRWRREAEVDEAVRKWAAARFAWDKVDSALVAFEDSLAKQAEDDDVDGAIDRRRRFYAALVGEVDTFPNPAPILAALAAVEE